MLATFFMGEIVGIAERVRNDSGVVRNDKAQIAGQARNDSRVVRNDKAQIAGQARNDSRVVRNDILDTQSLD